LCIILWLSPHPWDVPVNGYMEVNTWMNEWMREWIMLKILGATVQNIVGWATKCLGYVKPCCESSVVAMWFPSEYQMFLCDTYTK